MVKTSKRNVFHASVMAAALSLSSAGAYAAGLGKITVLSQLGQPLRAELDVSASREELSSMAARLAPNDAFKQIGVEYAPILAAMRFSLDKRADGKPFIRITTERPVNDPFLDMLVELTWSSGRVVREYTVLLDPPLEVRKPVAAAVVVPETRVPATVTAKPAEPPAAVAAPEAKRPVAAPTVAAPAAEKPATAENPVAEEASRTVAKGDTLAKIARETKGEDVSLDQMLVALFRGNPSAFDGNNMNRLRAGRILSIPDAATAAAIPAGEARSIIVSQASDFNAYRQRLATTVAATPAMAEEAPRQESAGKIVPKVEEKLPPEAAGKDKLEVSRTQVAKGGTAEKELRGRISSLEEDLVARERALKEANSRIAQLERNVTDLKKLAELKSQAGAQMQQQAEAAKVPAPVPKAPEPPAPAVERPSPVKEAPVAAPEPPAPPPAMAEEAKPSAEVKPAEEPKPVEPPAPKKPVVTPPPPPPEPSFMDEWGTLVYGGAGILALVAGYFAYSARKRRQLAGGPTTSRISEGDLTANSVFGTTGGQAVDTGASIQTDFSQSSLGAIDADEGVDPVAEADVYMAYGRDAQAEEILIDALRNDPARHAIHLKLLEIYAGRKSLKQFEELATDLHGQTGGAGQDWEKAAALGRSIDPENALYGGQPGAAVEDKLSSLPDLAATTVIIPPAGPAPEPMLGTDEEPAPEKFRDTVTLPGQLSRMAKEVEAPPPSPVLDFDLDLGGESAPVPKKEPVPAAPASLDFDLDLGAPEEATPAPDEPEPEPKPAPVAPARTPVPPPLRPDEMTHLNLELPTGGADAIAMDRGEPTHINPDYIQNQEHPAEAAALDFEFDLGLDADSGMPAGPAEVVADAAAAGEEDNPDVATKLELAQAYEEMGDKEGAKELLQEVLNEGSSGQRDTARAKLAALEA